MNADHCALNMIQMKECFLELLKQLDNTNKIVLPLDKTDLRTQSCHIMLVNLDFRVYYFTIISICEQFLAASVFEFSRKCDFMTML